MHEISQCSAACWDWPSSSNLGSQAPSVMQGSIWRGSFWTLRKLAGSWTLSIYWPTGVGISSLDIAHGFFNPTSGGYLVFWPRTQQESESIFHDGREFIRIYLKLAQISVRSAFLCRKTTLNSNSDKQHWAYKWAIDIVPQTELAWVIWSCWHVFEPLCGFAQHPIGIHVVFVGIQMPIIAGEGCKNGLSNRRFMLLSRAYDSVWPRRFCKKNSCKTFVWPEGLWHILLAVRDRRTLDQNYRG